MEANRELENKLWSVSSENPLDEQTCKLIIDYLFKTLIEYLKQPLEIIGEDFVTETSFCRSFRGEIANTPFQITYVGVIGMQLIDDEFGTHTSANLYLFGSHHRLTAGQPDRSYIYLEYQKGENGVGNWISRGWEIDEFDEYEDIIESEFL